MSNIAIKAENLSKRYRIGLKEELHDTFIGAFTSWLKSPVFNFRRLQKLSKFSKSENSEDIIWALKDVSFEVKYGEVLGIIGSNGAGKSTLLKILCRITEPTSGRAEAHGRVASLLEVGTGFHGELTGRENVFLNGAILGMTKREIEFKFDEIVDFSGVEKFIDTPVKRYSSGMNVRLAFAVAAHLEPEILLVDEVLAVGDVEFQQKCLGKMQSVAKGGRTVLLVSHNMAAIRNLCERTILIESGRIVVDGNANFAIKKYLERNLQRTPVTTEKQMNPKVEGWINRNNPSIRLKEIALIDQKGKPRCEFQSDEEIRVSITYKCLTVVNDLRVMVYIVDEENLSILSSHNMDDVNNLEYYRKEPGVYKSYCILPANMFGQGRFYVTVQLIYPKVEHLIFKRGLYFDVKFNGYNNYHPGSSKDAFLRPQLSWSTQFIERNQVIVNE